VPVIDRNITATRRRARINSSVAAGLLLFLSAGAIGSSQPAGAGRYRVRTRQLTKGLMLSRIIDARGPNRIKVLKMNPASSLRMDVALSNDTLPGLEKTTSMARRHHAVAAVNASFFLPWGRPLGIFAADGSLKASPIAEGARVSAPRNERGLNIGHRRLSIRGFIDGTDDRFRVSAWNNQSPNRARIAGYTRAGGKRVPPPRHSCSVRLVPRGRMRWGPDGIGVERRYRVGRIACSKDRLWLADGIVIASRRGSRGSVELRRLRFANSVRLRWSVGWPSTLDAVAGSPVLMKDGAIVIKPCSAYVCRRHPRTGVGVTRSGRIYMVVVDGRQRGSKGMTIVQFARLFKRLGVRSAVNLDGGGSSTMVVKNHIVNSPSDPGGQRAVASALLVIRGRDAGESRPRPPAGAGAASAYNPSPSDAAASRRSGELALKDPASTGGLLHALSEGEFGASPAALEPELLRAAHAFEVARRPRR
jgi:hypothetical protein